MREQDRNRLFGIFRWMRYVAVAVLLTGIALDAVVGGGPGVVIFVCSWLLSLWLFATGYLQSRRQAQPATAVRDAGGAGVEKSRPVEPPGSSEWERRRQAALRSYSRFFFRRALLGLGVSVIGFVGGVELNGLAQALVIGVVGCGGLLLSWTSAVIARRIRTGPRR